MNEASVLQSGYLFTRHTFITKAKAYNVDEYILKLIVGHSIEDITEKVYTHRTIEQLRNEIENKIILDMQKMS
jgi:integrase